MVANNNSNDRTDTEFDGRIGERMIEAMITLEMSDGVAPSKWSIAKQLYRSPSTQYGMPVVDRCVRRGFIKIDSDHPESEPRGAGAVALIDKGRRFLDASIGGQNE